MVQKAGMHTFTDGVVALKGKTQITHPAYHMRMGQMRSNVTASFNVILGVVCMFHHACSNSENIRVKKNVLWRELQLIHQQMVHARTHFNAVFVSIRLSVFVKSHTDQSKTATANRLGLFKKCGFPFLEADGIHNAFALHAFHARF